jgi:hypothetical protein
MLAARFPRGRIVQVAHFEDRDNRYLEELQQEKAHNVNLIPLVEYSAMAGWYARSDLVVGQFKIGMAGLVELQSMSCGRPVVFFDQQYSYGVSEPSVEMAYNFSVNAITQPQYRLALVRKGLDIVHRIHDSDKVATEFMGSVRSLT